MFADAAVLVEREFSRMYPRVWLRDVWAPGTITEEVLK
jgi:hypothetical protein